MEKAAALDPDLYLSLGGYYVDRDMNAEACAAFLQAFEKANDRVWMGNSALWLVQYLVSINDPATAKRVAEDAAETYSALGLEAYLWLMKNDGNWDKALETARKIDERYNNGIPEHEVACLLVKQQALGDRLGNNPAHESKIRKIFPDGLQKLTIEECRGLPLAGVRLNGQSPAMVPFALRRDMVIVGLNGYRTDTVAQYSAVRAMSNQYNMPMSLIVWDGTGYRMSEGVLPAGRFDVDIRDYHGK
jgi:tetratricopeptide (TPR) repeat protein